MYPNQNKISVLMLGDGAVGKTSLLKMYAEGTFQESHMATMGLDYISKAFTPNDSDTEIPVKIWDTGSSKASLEHTIYTIGPVGQVKMF